jgi:putative transposase
LDAWVVMPNHLHGILVLGGGQCKGEKARIRGDHKDRPYGTLPGTVGRIIQAFKSITTREYIVGVKQHGWRRFSGRLWLRNYFEHVIRDDDAISRVREYVLTNPARWELDREHPKADLNAKAPYGRSL